MQYLSHLKLVLRGTFILVFSAIFFFIHGFIPAIPIPAAFDLDSLWLWIESYKAKSKPQPKISIVDLTDKTGKVRMSVCERDESEIR